VPSRDGCPRAADLRWDGKVSTAARRQNARPYSTRYPPNRTIPYAARYSTLPNTRQLIRFKIQVTTNDATKYANDCRFATPSKGVRPPALPGAGQPHETIFQRSSDFAPLSRELTPIINNTKEALALPGAYRFLAGMVAYNKSAGRDRRARSVSSSPDGCSPNSGCRRRSPRPLEFRADLLRIPSIMWFKFSVSIPAWLVNISGDFPWRQDPSGWPGRNGILLTVLGRPWGSSLRSAVRRDPLYLVPWEPLMWIQYQVAGASASVGGGWAWLEACGGTSSGTPLSLLLSMLLLTTMFRLPHYTAIKIANHSASLLELTSDTIARKKIINQTIK